VRGGKNRSGREEREVMGSSESRKENKCINVWNKE